jgi:hypothetical protein
MTTTRITGSDGLEYDVTYTLTPATLTPAIPATMQPEKLVLSSVVPVLAPPPPPPPPPNVLQPSGSITVTADYQVIEGKLVTGRITANGRTGVTIRNCMVKHPGGEGITATNCTNFTVQDCKIINTNATSGVTPNTENESKNIALYYGGPHTIQRVYVEGAGAGIYPYQCTGKVNISFLEGHKARAGVGNRGNLVQFNQCKGGALMEDFSSENPMNDSWTGDIVSTFLCTGSYIYRRGLIDGCNHPAGCGFMFESTSGALVEDCDTIHMGNGAFACYSGAGVAGISRDTIYRRCRVKDTVQKEIGRGPISSGYTSFISSPGSINTHFEQVKYFNVNEPSLVWDASTITVKDWAKADFTPRAPIRLTFGWV